MVKRIDEQLKTERKIKVLQLGLYLGFQKWRSCDQEDAMIFRSGSVDESHPKATAKRSCLWMMIVFVTIAGGILAIAAAVGIEDHQDQVVTAQLTNTEGELRTAGGRIADIKDRRFNTMAEYVNAYAQIEPLLDDYDHKLQEYSES